jgi:hypothetical protein
MNSLKREKKKELSTCGREVMDLSEQLLCLSVARRTFLI